MLIAAAVCPHPPLLLPEVTGPYGPGISELGRLRTACRAAVAALVGEAPDLLVVVGGAERTAEYPPAALGDPPELFAAGRAAWQVLAGAASRAGARDAFQGDLRYAAAPFEVSYYVATWRLRAH